MNGNRKEKGWVFHQPFFIASLDASNELDWRAKYEFCHDQSSAICTLALMKGE